MEPRSTAANDIEAHPRAAIVEMKIAGNGRLELPVGRHQAGRHHSVQFTPQTGTAFHIDLPAAEG